MHLVTAMEISTGSQRLGDALLLPVALCFAKLSSLIASSCRKRKYSSKKKKRKKIQLSEGMELHMDLPYVVLHPGPIVEAPARKSQ